MTQSRISVRYSLIRNKKEDDGNLLNLFLEEGMKVSVTWLCHQVAKLAPRRLIEQCHILFVKFILPGQPKHGQTGMTFSGLDGHGAISNA